jgi:hypothetical protein
VFGKAERREDREQILFIILWAPSGGPSLNHLGCLSCGQCPNCHSEHCM